MNNSIKLRTDSILQIPIQNYQKNFTFIVNGKKYETNIFVADLISSKISKIHQADPTINEYFINTQSNGDFNNVLQLINFESKSITDEELPFVREIIEDLCTEKIDININIENQERSISNSIQLIKIYEIFQFFYSTEYSKEIDFISEHFYELKEEELQELSELRYDTVVNIINNKKLSLDTEDQLIKFIIEKIKTNKEYSNLFEYVYFKNLSTESINEFLNSFDTEYLTVGLWNAISIRLKEELKNKECDTSRYKKRTKEVPFSNNELKGLFNYFRTQSNIDDEVKVTYSSYSNGDLKLLLDIENTTNHFFTQNIENSWVCFEFKKHNIIPSSYSIRSKNHSPGGCHPKNWIIQGSVDGNTWIKVDEQKNCSYLNGKLLVHTFPIQNQIENKKEQGFKYIRLQQTAPNFNNDNYLEFCSIEFYGIIV